MAQRDSHDPDRLRLTGRAFGVRKDTGFEARVNDRVWDIVALHSGGGERPLLPKEVNRELTCESSLKGRDCARGRFAAFDPAKAHIFRSAFLYFIASFGLSSTTNTTPSFRPPAPPIQWGKRSARAATARDKFYTTPGYGELLQ